MDDNKFSLNQSAHKEQTLLQVWLPLGLGTIIILGFAVLTVTTSTGNGIEGGRLAGISLIFLIIPSLVICFFIFILLSLLIFGIYKITEIIPIYSFKAQTYIVLVSDFILLWSNRIAQPVFYIKEGLAGLHRLVDMTSPKSSK